MEFYRGDGCEVLPSRPKGCVENEDKDNIEPRNAPSDSETVKAKPDDVKAHREYDTKACYEYNLSQGFLDAIVTEIEKLEQVRKGLIDPLTLKMVGDSLFLIQSREVLRYGRYSGQLRYIINFIHSAALAYQIDSTSQWQSSLDAALNELLKVSENAKVLMTQRAQLLASGGDLPLLSVDTEVSSPRYQGEDRVHGGEQTEPTLHVPP